MKKVLFIISFLGICVLTSCEKGDYGSPNYNNQAGPNTNNNNNRPVNTVTVNPPQDDTSWYYRFPVNTWVPITNFYLENVDFVFKLNIPSVEFNSGDFIVEMWWDGNSAAKLRYRCLRPGAIDHMGLLYVTEEQNISFTFRYTGKNTEELPLYSVSFPAGLNLNITYEPQSNTVQRYLLLQEWNGAYTLYRESDGLFNLGQAGNNTSGIFFGPL